MKMIDRLAAYEDTGLSPEEIIELKGQNGGAREVKRLTHTLKSGSWGIRGDVDDAVLRLAAIEDILGDEYDLDRLRELVQADRERRTVSDLVRNMSDDELLELIEEIRIHCCPPLCDQNHYCDEDCYKGIAAWLKGPADERILEYLKRPKMKEGASEDTSP